MHIRRTGLMTLAMVVMGLGACGGPAATPTAAPATQPAGPSDAAIAITVPAYVAPGASFNASWTGAETSGDFFVIVPAGATTWTETADSPYFNATLGNPAPLVAPKTPGSYEVWFVKGEMGSTIVIKARAPLVVK